MLALAYLRPEEDQSIWSKRRQGFQPCCEAGIREPTLSDAIIQTKSRATPEQDRKPANEAYHDEAGTKQCTYITLLPSEGAPIRR